MQRYPFTAAASARPTPVLPGGRLDDGAAGGKPAATLGLIDHRDADAVLDAPAGIDRLELDKHPRGHLFGEPMQLDQGSPTDRFEDVPGNPRLRLVERGRVRVEPFPRQK